MQEEEVSGFRSWAILELFGHKQIAGMVREIEVAGAGFIRVDIPEVDGKPGFTRIFGPKAIYSINPCDEATAKIAARSCRDEPYVMWQPSRAALLGSAPHYDIPGDDDDSYEESDDDDIPI